ncbi:MAG TPA: transposase [Stellaceae bacterium]|nr:transposase [Stellaceae bacterium]
MSKRRTWSEALKRQIVAETEEPGSSVSVVARRHDVNANQVFKWRRELLPREQRTEDVGLLPVEIVPAPPARLRRRRAKRAGLIEIEFGSVRVLIRGEVMPRTLRQVIELLR